MVFEFTVHPKNTDDDTSDIKVGVSSLKIPRLKKSEAANLQLATPRADDDVHYHGAKRCDPPVVAESDLDDADEEHLKKSLRKAKERDAAYLSQRSTNEAIEFSG